LPRQNKRRNEHQSSHEKIDNDPRTLAVHENLLPWRKINEGLRA
jgi:hypothetical protein